VIWIFITFIPTLYEAWTDRKGESRKSKIKDTIWLTIGAAIIAGVSWCFGENVLAILLLIVTWRVSTFDYLVTYLLKRNDVINPKANVWNYTGKTTHFWDQFIGRMDWRIRLIARIVILTVSIFLFSYALI